MGACRRGSDPRVVVAYPARDVEVVQWQGSDVEAYVLDEVRLRAESQLRTIECSPSAPIIRSNRLGLPRSNVTSTPRASEIRTVGRVDMALLVEPELPALIADRWSAFDVYALRATVMSLDADGRVVELTTFVLPELFAAWGFPPVLDA